MRRVGRWLERGRVSATGSTHSLDSAAEAQDLQSALQSVDRVMDDDFEGAEKGLADGTSAFHKLGRATTVFLRAALGFEQEQMRGASNQLYEAETSAIASYTKSQHDSTGSGSVIYDKGAEYTLCQAESMIMSAIVGVMNESITDSIKGFYKLRKAYLMLQGLVQMEDIYVKTRFSKSLAGSRDQSYSSLQSIESVKLETAAQIKAEEASRVGKSEDAPQVKEPSGLRNAEVVNMTADDESDDFQDVDEVHEKEPVTESYSGKIEMPAESLDIEEKMNGLTIPEDIQSPNKTEPEAIMLSSTGTLSEELERQIFNTPLDIFIHSGISTISGILSLLLSMIPPAFSRLLYIVGFRGDREKGLQLLWRASHYENINGGMAGLMLFVWYNGLVSFCDVVPDTEPGSTDNIAGYPRERLKILLGQMRKRYPKSFFWKMEEARMASSERNLGKALELLSQPGKSQLRQLEALLLFEKSLTAMGLHQYELCAKSFLACVDLNNWTQSMYYYIAGAAHLQLYRQLAKDPELEKEANKHRTLAEDNFKTVPSKVGKKKMMGRQLPFDVFVQHKINKWEARATRWNCSFIDAIGVSPLEEMIYLWNGYKKMGQQQLDQSLANLEWSENQARWKEDDLDEHGLLKFLRAVILRHLRQHDESKEILKSCIIDGDIQNFKGHLKEDWLPPAAHYEMGANLWMQRTHYIREHGTSLDESKILDDSQVEIDLDADVKLVHDAKKYIETAKNWDGFLLQNRLGVKVTTAHDTIKKWEEKHQK